MALVFWLLALAGLTVLLSVAIRSNKRCRFVGRKTLLITTLIAMAVFLLGSAWHGLASVYVEGHGTHVCKNNLAEVRAAVQEYEARHHGFPDSLDDLVAEALIKPERIRCPRTGAKYEYRKPSTRSSRDGPLCWDSEAHRNEHFILRCFSKRHWNVLYGTMGISEEEFPPVEEQPNAMAKE